MDVGGINWKKVNGCEISRLCVHSNLKDLATSWTK